MAYVIEFADDIEESDTVFEEKGVKIVVDPKCLLYLDGTELDFTKEGLNEGFKFIEIQTKKLDVVVVKASASNGYRFYSELFSEVFELECSNKVEIAKLEKKYLIFQKNFTQINLLMQLITKKDCLCK